MGELTYLGFFKDVGPVRFSSEGLNQAAWVAQKTSSTLLPLELIAALRANDSLLGEYPLDYKHLSGTHVKEIFMQFPASIAGTAEVYFARQFPPELNLISLLDPRTKPTKEFIATLLSRARADQDNHLKLTKDYGAIAGDEDQVLSSDLAKDYRTQFLFGNRAAEYGDLLKSREVNELKFWLDSHREINKEGFYLFPLWIDSLRAPNGRSPRGDCSGEDQSQIAAARSGDFHHWYTTLMN